MWWLGVWTGTTEPRDGVPFMFETIYDFLPVANGVAAGVLYDGSDKVVQ